MFSLKAGFVYRCVNGQDTWELNRGAPHGKEQHIGFATIDGMQCAVFSDGLQELAQSVRLASDAQEIGTSTFRAVA